MTIGSGLDSLESRAKWTRWLLIAYLVEGAVVLLIGFYTLFNEFSYLPTGPTTQIVAGLASLASILLFLACAAAVMLWTHRAHANLREMGLEGLRYSPGWASWSFIVPIAGLIVPFLAMRQLANRSEGEDVLQADASVADVSSWWACYVAGNLLQAFIMLKLVFNLNGLVFVVTPRGVDTALLQFSSLLLLGAAWFLYRIIGSVTEAQRSGAGLAEAFA